MAAKSQTLSLPLKQELFCRYYVFGCKEFRFGNGIASYAKAYGYDLSDEKKYNVAGVEAHRLPHAIPARVSECDGDFVQGDADKLTIKALSDAEQERVDTIVNTHDLHEKIYDWAVNQSEFGYTVLLSRVEEGEFVIDEVDPQQYFPQADGSTTFAGHCYAIGQQYAIEYEEVVEGDQVNFRTKEQKNK